MRLLALVDAPEHVCCRYRIRAFEPALADAGCTITYQAIRRGLAARSIQLSQASRYDAVILQRKLLSRWQTAILARSARRLIFDFDDAVLYRDSYDPRGVESPRLARRFAATVKAADTIIAGNDFLADCALRAGASTRSVRTIPTCVNPALYPSKSEFPKGESRGNSSDPITLVWIGSSSTLQGLEQRKSLWERIGREVPNLKLRIICDRFPEFQSLQVEPVPWSEASEARALAEGDVGISWIPDDPWSRGKCGLKVLQYQAAGLPVLANSVGVHPEMIAPGKTGFLADDDDAWVTAVKLLANDHDLRTQMGRRARERIASDYSLDAWTATFINAVTGIERPSVHESPPPVLASANGLGTVPEPRFLRCRRTGVNDLASSTGNLNQPRDFD